MRHDRGKVAVKGAGPAVPERTSASSGSPGAFGRVLRAQHHAGNRAVTALLQPKLTVGAAGDRYELEADRVADEVMGLLRRQPVGAPLASGVQGGDEAPAVAPRVRRMVQASSDPVIGLEGGPVDATTDAAIKQARGGGSQLDASVRRSMEAGFGADFSGVRVHHDATAHRLNEAIQARAFTTGNDIFFRSGEYKPHSREGQRLIAHELTHTLQQGASRAGRSVSRMAGGAQRTVIQRNGLTDLLEEGQASARRAFGLVVTGLNQLVNMAGGHDRAAADAVAIREHAQYETGDLNAAATRGAEAAGVLSVLGAGADLTAAAVAAERARRIRNDEAAEHRQGQIVHESASRDRRVAGGDVVEATGSVGSSGTGLGATSVQIAGATGQAANIVSGIGSAIALPFQLFATGRLTRKAVLQWQRVSRLTAGLIDPNNPPVKHGEVIKRLSDSQRTAAKMITDYEAAALPLVAANPALGAEAQRNLACLIETERRFAQLIVDQRQAWNDMTQTMERERDEAAVRAAAHIETPKDIRVYAIAKNESGAWRKIVSVVGGALGIGGGIAATVAAFTLVAAGGALGAATLATPVGWGLAGAAALVAVAAGGVALFKWLSKRVARARAKGATTRGAALKMALTYGADLGESRRQRNARRLYEYAFEDFVYVDSTGGPAPRFAERVSPDQRDDARAVIADLLTPPKTLESLNMSGAATAHSAAQSKAKETSVKYLADKLKSA